MAQTGEFSSPTFFAAVSKLLQLLLGDEQSPLVRLGGLGGVPAQPVSLLAPTCPGGHVNADQCPMLTQNRATRHPLIYILAFKELQGPMVW